MRRITILLLGAGPGRRRRRAGAAGAVAARACSAPAGRSRRRWCSARCWTRTSRCGRSTIRTCSEWVGLLNPRGEIDFNGRHARTSTPATRAALDRLPRPAGAAALRAARALRGAASAQPARLAVLARFRRCRADAPIAWRSRRASCRSRWSARSAFDASGGFTGAVSPKTTLDGGYGFSDVQFDRNAEVNRFLRGGHSNAPAPRSDARADAAVLGGRRLRGPRHASVAAGEQIFDVQSLAPRRVTRFTRATSMRGGVGATYMAVPTAGCRCGVRRSRVARSQRGRGRRGRSARSAVRAVARLRRTDAADHRVGRRRAAVRQGTLRRLRPPVVRGDAPGRDDCPGLVHLRSVFYTATVGYAINRWLRVEGFYTGAHQTSSARGLIDRTRVGFQFVTSKPVRIQ